MTKLPKTKLQNIVVQQLEKELLIYDLTGNEAFCLNETSAVIFNACDGETTFDELKRQTKFTDDLIHFTLDELKRKNLILDQYQTNFGRLSRREIVKRVGLATMIALPVISNLIAPQAINAQSTCPTLGQRCIPNNYLQSNCCNGLRCSPLGNPPFCTTCGERTQFFTTCANAGNCQNCDSAPEKNLCCSSAPSINNGTFCYCG